MNICILLKTLLAARDKNLISQMKEERVMVGLLSIRHSHSNILRVH